MGKKGSAGKGGKGRGGWTALLTQIPGSDPDDGPLTS